jgi:formiminotetrahydrofolate cyclodeaminase
MKTKEAASIPQKTDEESRREFLIKAGKMALYISPAMMVLMHPSGNALACSSRPSNCGWKPNSGWRKWR